MKIEDGPIAGDTNSEKTESLMDSRKRIAEDSMDDRVATKRMSVSAENGDASNNNLNPDNSVETAALQERVLKLERMYQRSCRATREAEIRAERAEKTIASMQAEGTMKVIVSKKEIVVKEEAKVSNNQHQIDNSAEMASLKEQVKKLERMFEKSCLTAREAELRAERAEKIIDSKHGIRDSVEKNKEMEQLQKRFAEISDELENAKKREEARSREDKRVIDEMRKKLAEAEMQNLWRGGDMNNIGLRQRITELNRLLAESMRRERMADKVVKEQAKQLKEKETPKELKEKENNTKKSTEKETPKDSEEPTNEAVSMEVNKEQKEMRRQQKQHHRESTVEELEVFKEVEGLLASVSEKTDDFLAILTPCTIPGKFVDVDSAAIFLKHKFYHVWDRRIPFDERPQLKGKCCGKSVGISTDFIRHFGGKKHTNMMAKGGGGVSIAALNQWVEAMEGDNVNEWYGKEVPTADPLESRERLSKYISQTVRAGGGVSIAALNQWVDTVEGDKDTNGKDAPTAEATAELGTEMGAPLAGGSIKVKGESVKKGEIGGETAAKKYRIRR